MNWTWGTTTLLGLLIKSIRIESNNTFLEHSQAMLEHIRSIWLVTTSKRLIYKCWIHVWIIIQYRLKVTSPPPFLRYWRTRFVATKDRCTGLVIHPISDQYESIILQRFFGHCSSRFWGFCRYNPFATIGMRKLKCIQSLLGSIKELEANSNCS